MRTRIGVIVVCLAAGLSVGVGCKSSSHKSVRTYEYNNEPKQPDPHARQRSDELDSEYKMVSPGEMQSPGQMTDDR